jgi:hypothetical protein
MANEAFERVFSHRLRLCADVVNSVRVTTMSPNYVLNLLNAASGSAYIVSAEALG